MNKKKLLLNWYFQNRRKLPWRETQKKALDPYKIWISEIMLQQTTSVTVIPYYEAFFKKFPSLQSLAIANENDVLEAWSGLGYYTRAKNIHKTAQVILKKYKGQFPKAWQKLIALPGIGPYTSRAIASFTFGQKVGVLDGNVIRFLARYHLIKEKWWTTQGRSHFQSLADQWAKDNQVADINQALIEIGAKVCLPQSPNCHICPLQKTCKSYQHHQIETVPLMRLRRKPEPWLWKPLIYHHHRYKNKVLLVKNHHSAFLKGQWIWPGQIQKLKNPPEVFDFKHTITHHNIYVQMQKKHFQSDDFDFDTTQKQWVDLPQIKKYSPTSLIAKTLFHKKCI